MNLKKKSWGKMIVMIITIGLFVSSCTSKKIIKDLYPYLGVWANQNSELVQTEKYTLIFINQSEKITTILRRNINVSDTIYSEFVLGYVFDKNTKSYEKVEYNNEQKRILIGNLMKLKENKLELTMSSSKQILDMIEKIEVSSPYDMPLASEGTIGECLQSWQLGTTEYNLDLNDFRLEIGTNKHLYVFLSNPNILYCRAARIRSNEHGSVFSQNIRLMFNANTKETTVSMNDDNYMIAKSDININNSLFKPDVCSFEDDGIYWSLIYYEPSIIKLNGCGDIYTYERPLTDDKNRVEWFKYNEY